ncbi:hypothetical protein ASE01_00720 [Nocardioides sp. Root190]|uniref:PQ-loop repeat-containing protein n=1 Tax=Nocardioides sp. Root190 TaxID=1736488 RepID=UPI0006FF9CD6|nr:PQ-loop repeat-containing protein [Nocardioides sp. Root190]KRB80062.1 hypothetical protein ASE01_00720 [Nocardioides sp. Root190]
MTAALGWLVGVVDVAQFLPQARRTHRRRHDPVAMGGLSVWTWAIATVQGAAWIVYGFANELWAIAIPNLVITPVCALILLARLRHAGPPARPV